MLFVGLEIASGFRFTFFCSEGGKQVFRVQARDVVAGRGRREFAPGGRISERVVCPGTPGRRCGAPPASARARPLPSPFFCTLNAACGKM